MKDNANIDFLQGGGNIASLLLNNKMDVGLLRPWLETNKEGAVTGRGFATNSKGISMPVQNNALLRKDEWIMLDQAVGLVARDRLQAVADLRAKGLVYNLPNALGHTVLQTQNQSDIGDAGISMDGLRQTVSERAEFDLTNIPIPIIHKDFYFSAREVAVSRNGGVPIDTSNAEVCGRKVAELAEKFLCGTAGSYKYGGGNIYGYENYPSRVTATVTAPTASGWTGNTLIGELLSYRQSLQDTQRYGPFTLYLSNNWDQYLDADYKVSTASSITLRQRIQAIFPDVKTLDYLTNGATFTVLMVQMSSDTVREIVGMDTTTVQWSTQGGMKLHYKVMAILVPQIRKDFNDSCGVLHAINS